jgi:hypothetical protein
MPQKNLIDATILTFPPSRKCISITYMSSRELLPQVAYKPMPSQPAPISQQKIKTTPLSIHKAQLPIRAPSFRNPLDTGLSRSDSRRVTFNEDTHPAHRPRSRSLSYTASTITPLDTRISQLGGTTSTLDCLPQRLRIAKSSQRVSPQQRVEELIRDNGHLRQELAYHKETRAACLKFFEATRQAQQMLHNAIAEMSRKAAISEQRFEDYWRSQCTEGNWEEHVF